MLTVDNVSFSYGSIRTLQDVCMSMNAGEVTCIMGRNGVGKTTLLKNIMGLLQSTQGSMEEVQANEKVVEAYLGR